MKNLIIVVLLAAVVTLGVVYVKRQSQLTQTVEQLSVVINDLHQSATNDDKLVRAEQRTKVLQETLAATTDVAVERTKKASSLEQSLEKAKSEAGAGGLGALFKDPKMRDMIKSQQQAILGPMIDRQYTTLLNQLNLPPEQSQQLRDLLKKKMSVGMEAGMSALDGSKDPAQMAELGKQIKAETDSYSAEIKQMLGDANYQKFQEYEQTMPSRMVLSQFNDQLANGPNALGAEQQTQLIQAMTEEQKAFPSMTDPNKLAPNGDFTAMFTEEKINQMAQDKEKLDAQVLVRARQILTPPQAASFEQFQTSQRDLQIASMKMAARMFGPK